MRFGEVATAAALGGRLAHSLRPDGRACVAKGTLVDGDLVELHHFLGRYLFGPFFQSSRPPPSLCPGYGARGPPPVRCSIRHPDRPANA